MSSLTLVAVARDREATEMSSLAPRWGVLAFAVADNGTSSASVVVSVAHGTGFALGFERVLVLGVLLVLIVFLGQELGVRVLEPIGDDLALDCELRTLVAGSVVKVAVDGRIAADTVALTFAAKVDHRALVLTAPLFEGTHVVSANGLLANAGAFVSAVEVRAATLVAVTRALFGIPVLVLARKTAVGSLDVDLETTDPSAFVATDMSASTP